jgi:mannose-6-phosphate isomerase
MLVPIANEPREYAWGSTTLIAGLEGRAPSGRPEAEVWFGDHPQDPSVTPDGRTLDAWLADEGTALAVPRPLPYLLKLLAAASALSIQAHPSKRQAEEGFAREESARLSRDAAARTYRDDNHKPELIVALSDEFRALAGLRALDASRRLAAALGAGGSPLADRLAQADASLRDVLGWVLSPAARGDVEQVIAAAVAARSEEFAAELDVARTLQEGFPGDPGIVLALLMNLVTLRRGEGLFVPAGVLHAYLEGLGVELMAASDNVLRGGLTPKHIDAPELLAVLDDAPGIPPTIRPRRVTEAIERYDVPIADFALDRVSVGPGRDVVLTPAGPTILLATAGTVSVSAGAETPPVRLAPGQAVLATPDESRLALSGEGEVFVAAPGRTPTQPA